MSRRPLPTIGRAVGRAHLLPLLLLAACASTPAAPAPRAPTRTIAIDGDEAFVRRIDDALDLLEARSPGSYALVERYVGRIRQAERSGMAADDTPPRVDLSDRTAHHSLTWCAGSLVHEAYHSMLYDRYLEARGPPVPGDVWVGTEVERAANARQLRALREIGAPTRETEYVAGLDGTHHDLDGDGKYTWADYWLRDW